LWLRYVLAVTAAAAVLVALVMAENSGNGAAPARENPAAEAEANRESQIVVAQDQAPHAAPLAHRLRPQLAIERAIAADASDRIRHNDMTGPLRRVRCARSGSKRSARQAFSCQAFAGDLRYPFLGVVDLRAGRVIWWKRDPPPAPGFGVATSPPCRA
jgi:hypothetical protein